MNLYICCGADGIHKQDEDDVGKPFRYGNVHPGNIHANLFIERVTQNCTSSESRPEA